MTSDSTPQPGYLWPCIKWIIAAAILGFLFYQTDTKKVFQAIAYADLTRYVPLSALFIGCWFLIESQNLTWLFTGFGHKVTFKEVRAIRGATYLLMIFNYNLGLGAMALYLNRAKKIPLSRTSGMMLFYLFVESLGIAFFAATGSFLIRDFKNPENTTSYLTAISAIATLLFALYILTYLGIRFLHNRQIFPKLTRTETVKTLCEADLPFCLTLTGFRAVYFLSFVLFFYLALKTFQISIPFLTLTAFVPVIFFIGNIPITPFGIGTLQAAMMFFFGPYGEREAILAFSVLYSFTLLAGRAPVGLFYMKME